MFLCDVDANQAGDAVFQFVAVFAGEFADFDHDAGLAVRDAGRGIADFAHLLAEDRAIEALFGSQFGFALGRDLADQDVPGIDFRADADDAVFVEILQGVIADVRDFAGDLFGTEFGVAGFAFVFLVWIEV